MPHEWDRIAAMPEFRAMLTAKYDRAAADILAKAGH